MKLSKVEWCVLALAGLLLAFTAGYFTGTRNAGSVSIAGVTVQTEALAEATVSVQPEESENTEEPAASGAESETAASEEDALQETESASEADSELVNINIATAEELTALPGIGEALAERIVAYREENGPFQSVQELTNVSGIGDGKLANILDYITVGE